MAMTCGTGRLCAAGVALALCAGLAANAEATEPAHASPWVTEQMARARLIAGGVETVGGERRLYAGLEIALEDGWKTYWRNPGSSGVPPRVETEGSENLARADLLFPAPRRFVDKDGDTIGYKQTVVLPLALTPGDANKPITLKVAAEFGICRDVCIPVQPTFSLTLPPGAAGATSGAALAGALEQVPRAGASGPGDPRLEAVKVDLGGARPSIELLAAFPGGTGTGDIFLEAPDGIWIPLPRAQGEVGGNTRRFTVDLTDGADLTDLRGKTIRATLVGTGGQSEATFKLE